MAGRSATSRTIPLGSTSRSAIGAAQAGATPAATAITAASTTTSRTHRSGEAGIGHPGKRLLLVHTLVVPDLTEDVGQGFELAVIFADHAVERLPLQLGILADERHVLVLGVVLELGVEPVGPGGVDHVEQPDDLVVDEGDHLRQQPELHVSFANLTAGNQLLQNQQVPLLVVLLLPAL